MGCLSDLAGRWTLRVMGSWYILLTEREVRMGKYWSLSFYVFMDRAACKTLLNINIFSRVWRCFPVSWCTCWPPPTHSSWGFVSTAHPLLEDYLLPPTPIRDSPPGTHPSWGFASSLAFHFPSSLPSFLRPSFQSAHPCRPLRLKAHQKQFQWVLFYFNCSRVP